MQCHQDKRQLARSAGIRLQVDIQVVFSCARVDLIVDYLGYFVDKEKKTQLIYQ